MIIHKYVKIAKLASLFLISLWLQAAVHTNALIHEPSPYLQQHAHNPVNWYPWGKKALEKAKKEHKLVFLSIGYSTCHWCHVMEEKSFSDKCVAALLNRDFVSIKVDREQYPQIDKKYQRIYQAVHGKRGGWPLSVFLTPKMEVLDIRTYVPKEEGYGSEGLLKLLPKLAVLRNDPQALQAQLAQVQQRMKQHSDMKHVQHKEGIEKAFLSSVTSSFDAQNGGFGTHPKFPEASKLETLMTLYRLDHNATAWKMTEKTLDAMAKGGVYDQIGGGFFRYTLDAAWQTPHFEKMLYTNAEIIRVYTKAYLLSGKADYRRIVNESIAAMQRHFGYKGLFFSAADADSNGEEGGYYLENYGEIRAALLGKGWQPESIDDNLAYYGIEEDGNIDGELSLPHITSAAKPPRAKAFKVYIASLRKRRTFPFVDRKINTAWNAMMIDALFVASRMDRRYLAEAETSLDALWRRMYRKGALYHQLLPDAAPKQKGLLEDYAFLTKAYLGAYERTYKKVYLKRAVKLASEALKRFYQRGVWYLDSEGIARADFDDRYYTSPLSVLLHSLLTLSEVGGKVQGYDLVQKSVSVAVKPSESPALVSLLMRLTRGDVLVHADKVRLLEAQLQIDHIRYPFILSQPEESSEYLACTRTSCFAHAASIEALIMKIDAYKDAEPQGAYRWQK